MFIAANTPQMIAVTIDVLPIPAPAAISLAPSTSGGQTVAYASLT